MIGREELFALAESPIKTASRAGELWLPLGKLPQKRSSGRELLALNFDLEDAIQMAGGARGSGYAPPTIAQQRILDYLRDNRDRLVNRFELRDACAPDASEGVIGVQIHYLRSRCGVAIESKAGPYGGYRLASAA